MRVHDDDPPAEGPPMKLDAAPQGHADRAVRTPSFLALVLALTLTPVAAGCFTTGGASANAIPMVRVQASGDLDCPQKDLRVVKNFGGEFEVFGCGQKATYNTACDGLRCVVAPPGQSVPWAARPAPESTPGSGFIP
jgi:hypothetical protein